MAEKIQSTIVNTIPLWKNQMVIALGLEHSLQAASLQTINNHRACAVVLLCRAKRWKEIVDPLLPDHQYGGDCTRGKNSV